MSTTLAKYTFSSWLRKGIGAKINEADNLGTGASAVKERPTVPVDIAVNSQNIHKDFSLLGPGDVIGINPAMVVRTEPRHWITNFEPNYLAFIEFYDEDFCWRYTPAKASGDKLRPWMVLLILKEDEFTKENSSFPLPNITVTKQAALPLHTDTWAWGHAHFNDGYNSSSEFEKFLLSLHNLNDPNADKTICRLMSPRKLEPDTAYYAFVVPAFETGRLAGLGQDTKDIDAQKPSWDQASSNPKLPIYYEWYFRTGKNEDFESLVKLLEPRVMDKRVGIRDMDGSKPGFGMTSGTDIGLINPPEANQEIIGLEGALKAPTTTSRPLNLDTSKPFFPELQNILNFPAELQKNSSISTDPVVTPPIYGENHAQTHELDLTKTGWLHTLNKDPRNRVPSGFGTDVIQRNQENYMARAWQQVQRILDANRKTRFAAFAMNVAQVVKMNFSATLNAQKTLLFFSPLLKKIKGSPTTLHFQLQDSNIPPAAVSPAMRKMIRPRGAFAKKLRQANPSFTHEGLITDLNNGSISAAPPKPLPKDILTIDDITSQLPSGKLSDAIKWILKNRLLLLIMLLVLFLLVAIATGLWLAMLVLAVAAVAAYFYSARLQQQSETESSLGDPSTLVNLIKSAPAQPAFRFVQTDAAMDEYSDASTSTSSTTEATTGSNATNFLQTTYFTAGAAGQDSIEAMHFRSAAVNMNLRLTVKAPETKRVAFDLINAQNKISAAVDPLNAYPKMLASMVYFSFNPNWLLQHENLVPAMAYPDFEDPMYEKLRDISPELLLPNLNLIPPNTISLLVTNPPFIESYMVGLNHEFGKELLWREYPTDTRCSSFRQFWDVKGIITNESNLNDHELVESYKDITPIDTWESFTLLGAHNRQHGKKNLVLVVRGELLKKYPNTIIYAQKAHIYKDPKTNAPNPAHEPVIIDVATKEQMQSEIKFPQFKADIEPDYKFFGFDLTIEAAYGDADPKTETDDWGYYFIIQQIPGEPVFGMDINYDPDDDSSTPITWDDMAWDKYDPAKKFIETASKPIGGFHPTGGGDSINQWGTDSASMAYILYQKPVMIAVHAKEMLEKL